MGIGEKLMANGIEQNPFGAGFAGFLPQPEWLGTLPERAYEYRVPQFLQTGMQQQMGNLYGLPQYAGLQRRMERDPVTAWNLAQFARPQDYQADWSMFQDFFPEYQSRVQGGGGSIPGFGGSVDPMNVGRALEFSKAVREGADWDKNPQWATGQSVLMDRTQQGDLTDAAKNAAVEIALIAAGLSGTGYYGSRHRANFGRMLEDYERSAFTTDQHAGGFLDYLNSLGYFPNWSEQASGMTDATQGFAHRKGKLPGVASGDSKSDKFNPGSGS